MSEGTTPRSAPTTTTTLGTLPALVTIDTERRATERQVQQLGAELNFNRLYSLPDQSGPSFLGRDYPYSSYREYIEAFAWWRAYVPPPPLPPGEDPAALAAAIQHLDEQAQLVERETNQEIPKIWHAASFGVVGQRVLVWGISLGLAGAALGAAVGGPYGALIGGVIGAAVGVCMGLVPWEASAFYYNWGQLMGRLTVEERYGLWRNAHDTMNTARRQQSEPEFPDEWQFSTNRAHILNGPVTDLMFLCYDTLFNLDCFPPPPGPVVEVNDPSLLPPVARYALGVIASTENDDSRTPIRGTYWYGRLQGGTANAWLKPLMARFGHWSVRDVRANLRQAASGDKPDPLPSLRAQPVPPYVAAAIAIREAAIRAEIPPPRSGS